MVDDWITTADAAQLTGYTPKHIGRLVKSGEVKGKRFGKRAWQVSRSSLLDYARKVEKMGEKRGPKSNS